MNTISTMPYIRENTFPVSKVRSDFPLLHKEIQGHPLVYLDNAATTQKPETVIKAISSIYENCNANVHRGIYALSAQSTSLYEEARQKVQKFIGAEKSSEIIFTRGTTESINLVARAYGNAFIKEGDEILLTGLEHHSNLIPWQMLCREKGCTLKFLPFTEQGIVDTEMLEKVWSSKIAFVACAHVSNVFGSVTDIKRIIDFAHSHDVPVLIDGAQSVPHMAVDVTSLDCDFLAFSGHKMLGPTGIGVLYGKEHLLDKMQPWQGGGEMIGAVWTDDFTVNELPWKFEAGTPPYVEAIALGVAIDYLNAIGLDTISAYVHHLTDLLFSSLSSIPGIHLYDPGTRRTSIASFTFDTMHPHDLAQFLDYKGIAVRAGHHCAQPVMRKLQVPATVRASLYLYNSESDVLRLVENIIAAKEFLDHGI